ncbi:MAG TPA: hypothetical protein VKY92_02280, partial [Verrucomicrobiae bacterium]|nr:hypothetical protein [Verrucomicrobiae bacterium]
MQRQLSDSRAIAIAERVISSSNRAQPADAVLRAELQGGRYAPESGSEASHYVFSYYRWRGWLDFREPLPAQILSAASLAQRFAKNPSSFSGDELVRRCVPEWIHREFEVSPALARSLQTEPRLWLRARTGTGPELARDLGDCAAFGAGALGDTLQYQGSQDLFRTAQFHKGQFEIQDISSQAVGLICD